MRTGAAFMILLKLFFSGFIGKPVKMLLSL